MSLTLRQCLETVARMGTRYGVIEQGREYTAGEVLAALARDQPDQLEKPMYLRLPDSQQDGAICAVTQRGGFLLRYRIHQHASPGG